MQESLISLLSCPVSRTPLQLQVITRSQKQLGHTMQEVVEEGILFADEDWFYPVIKGIPLYNCR
jgi:uncharacterized protein YbaR (Trm112 family)